MPAIPPVSTAYLFMYGDAMSGSPCRVGGIEDVGLGVWATAIAGSLSFGGPMADVALLVYGNAPAGSVASSEIEEDIIFIDAPMYGASLGGSLGTMRLFLDPYVPGLSRFLPEGQSS